MPIFSRWTDAWNDLMDFEIVPVRTSAEVVQLMTIIHACSAMLEPTQVFSLLKSTPIILP